MTSLQAFSELYMGTLAVYLAEPQSDMPLPADELLAKAIKPTQLCQYFYHLQPIQYRA